MNKKSNLGVLLILVIMAGTGGLLLREQSLSDLVAAVTAIRPTYVLLGLGLMLCFVGCEAMCSKLILGRLGHAPTYRQCLGYSFVGFYVSSITPSSTGGQPAQIYYMSKRGIPAAHGSLNMMLIAVCCQVVTFAYALYAFLLLPTVRQGMGTGLGLLLLYGGAVMLLLTAGMLCMMFLPHAAQKLTDRVLLVGVRLHLVKREAEVRAGLDRQMAAYRQGADCLRANLNLLPALLALTLLQLTCLYAVPCVVYLGFGLQGHSLFQLVGAQALVSMAVCFLPLPGGVGAAEGGALRTFTLFFGPGLVAPAVLVARGISFYGFLLLSGGVTLYVHLRTQKSTPPVAAPAAKHPLKGAKRPSIPVPPLPSRPKNLVS